MSEMGHSLPMRLARVSLHVGNGPKADVAFKKTGMVKILRALTRCYSRPDVKMRMPDRQAVCDKTATFKKIA